jgi:hypothetical protein
MQTRCKTNNKPKKTSKKKGLFHGGVLSLVTGLHIFAYLCISL